VKTEKLFLSACSFICQSTTPLTTVKMAQHIIDVFNHSSIKTASTPMSNVSM